MLKVISRALIAFRALGILSRKERTYLLMWVKLALAKNKIK